MLTRAILYVIIITLIIMGMLFAFETIITTGMKGCISGCFKDLQGAIVQDVAE